MEYHLYKSLSWTDEGQLNRASLMNNLETLKLPSVCMMNIRINLLIPLKNEISFSKVSPIAKHSSDLHNLNESKGFSRVMQRWRN